jgi:hypothetical protein
MVPLPIPLGLSFFETKAKSLLFLLIKKKVSNLLVENRAKTIYNTTGPRPHDTTGTSQDPKTLKLKPGKAPPDKMRQSPPPPERRHRDRYGRSGRRTVKK